MPEHKRLDAVGSSLLFSPNNIRHDEPLLAVRNLGPFLIPIGLKIDNPTNCSSRSPLGRSFP